MRPLLIVKVGDALPALLPEPGDYDCMVQRGAGLAPEQVRVVDPRRGEPLPPAAEVAGVVVTGSSAMVTDRAPWSVRTGEWLVGLVDADTPLLAICYGHQLLCDALGGTVGTNPNGREIGTIEVAVDEAAQRDDPLLGGLGPVLHVQATHRQAVLRLPPGAVHLASNPMDSNQAYRVGAHAWCVQFHPELDAHVIRSYIEARREALRGEGLDPDALARGCQDSDDGPTLLRRFAAMRAP